MRRTKTGFVLVVVTMVTTLFTLSGAQPAIAAVAPATAEAQFLSLLNSARAASGLSPMVRDGRIDGVARAWSASMASVYTVTGDPVVNPYAPNDCRQSALCHRPDLVNQIGAIEPNWQLIGENVGTGWSVQSLHDSFMGSGGHRANILGNYNRVGIGVVTQGERIWVTFDFLNGPPISGSTGNDGAIPVTPTASQVPGPVVPLSGRTRYNAIAPVRVLDTRIGLGGYSGWLGAGATLRLKVAGTAYIPLGAGGAAINLTATEARGTGFLTVYPCGQGRPLASNLNLTFGATRANLVVVALDGTGDLCIFTSVTTHVVGDLAGWYGGGGSAYRPVAPVRLRDTRQTGGPVQNLAVPLAGRVPADSTAVTLNVTVTEPVGFGFVTVYPCGQARPTASNVNYRPGQTVPNLVTVKLGAGGQVCVFSMVPAHIVVDLAGSYGTSGTTLTAAVPDRFLDTRDGTGGWLGALGGHQSVQLDVGGEGGVPAGATAAVLNVTVTQTFAPGYLTAYPCDSAPPMASNLNFVSGDTVPNLVVVKLDGSGRVCLTSNVRTYVVADLDGWFL